MTNTQRELEDSYEHVYYFKNLSENPLKTLEPGDTTQIENMEVKIKATGQIEYQDQPHGFIAGDTVE